MVESRERGAKVAWRVMSTRGQLSKTEPMDPAATIICGGARLPGGDSGVMEDRDIPKGKEEPAAAIGVADRSIEEGPQVCGKGGVTTDKGRAGGTREPGEAERQRVSGGEAKVEPTGRWTETEQGDLRRSHRI